MIVVRQTQVQHGRGVQFQTLEAEDSGSVERSVELARWREIFGASPWPTVVTLIGLGLGVVGATQLEQLGWIAWALLACSAALDGIDGWLARKLDSVSRFGASLDLGGDSVIASLLAISAFGPAGAGWVFVVLFLFAASSSGLFRRPVSGRTAITVAAFVSWLGVLG